VTIRLLTLADELNTDNVTVLRLAHDLRIRIDYDNRPLTELEAEKVRTLFAMTGGVPIAAATPSKSSPVSHLRSPPHRSAATPR
jgi:hypothetical protein